MKINITVQPGSTINNKTANWRLLKPNLSNDKCIGCGICSRVCPEGCIVMENSEQDQKPKPIINYDYCKGCGLCAEECPAKAIEMKQEKK